MLSVERDRQASSFGVEASLPGNKLLAVKIPGYARNDIVFLTKPIASLRHTSDEKRGHLFPV